ncbi:hypothetical protein PG993_002591 [Apiospora rasikravindrae]|uniref:Uncharacterized protein n=1 Tax=Apiospora rasikravindrae TaxID=990691 RepID=A0ABR1TX31_9PEZI
MLLRRGGFDFHGAPPALQRVGAEPDATIIAEQHLGEAEVVDRDLSHFEAPEPVAARVISVAVAIIAASLCLTFFIQRPSRETHFGLPGRYGYLHMFLCIYEAADHFLLFLDVLSDKHIPRSNNQLSQHTLLPIKTICPSMVKAHDVSPESCSFKLKWTDGMIGFESTNLGSHEINLRLRRLAVRAFFGSALTLVSTATNLIALMVLEGEPAWLCLLTCKTDGKLAMYLRLSSTYLPITVHLVDDTLTSAICIHSAHMLGGSILDHHHRRRLAEGHGGVSGRLRPNHDHGVFPWRRRRKAIHPASQHASLDRHCASHAAISRRRKVQRGSLDITPTPLPTAYHGILSRDPSSEDKGKGPAVEK